MEFWVLGPLEVRHGGRTIPLGGRRQRAVLAHLLLRANHVVPVDLLIGEVWGAQPPDEARNALQSYVSRLRKAFGEGDRIEGRPPGYVLHVQESELDALRLPSLVRQAQASRPEDPERALLILDEALGLWQGGPLADLADELSLQGEIARLERLWAEFEPAALEERIAAELDLGRHDQAVSEVEALVERFPLRERLWQLLMLALYRSGRQADALRAYQRAHRLLTDDGLDPSPELRRLHERILRQDPALSPEGRRLRGYRLAEEIGSGASGVVFRAIQPYLEREVAVKVIRPELADDPRFIRRFDAEAQVVARLEHPRIVPLHDYWREPGAAYLVMRWLRGGSLADALAAGPVGLDRALGIVDHVTEALAAAHQQEIVHRDVKPANILLDETGQAYLADFSVASAIPSQAMLAESGRSPYLSPEQIRGEPATPSTDVYGLGAVLREMLAGANVPAPLAAVVERATADRADARYPDAEAFGAAFTAAVTTAPAGAASGLGSPRPVAHRGPRAEPLQGPAALPRGRRGRLLRARGVDRPTGPAARRR